MISAPVEWETPQWLFDRLNEEFHFNLDPCCSFENRKCPRYFTAEDDGLAKSWYDSRVFMNPPYGSVLPKWVEKAYREYQEGSLVVGLLPARTDTRWFWDWIWPDKAQVRFIKGRLKFGDCKGSAPFPSMIVIWKPYKRDDSDDFSDWEKG
ncbi:DNA N-6-adenine-methyltransferase of bacteriophage [Spirochaetia bacterium]|nr:DNA N-6-adenine-methyltransferase of bacteriophage [Spirochaetia bacterium]